MLTQVPIGRDRILVTAYNPTNELTLLKCWFVLERVGDLEFTEAEFEAWATARGGGRLLAALKAGWQLPRDRILTIDPRNASEEMRIVSQLIIERAAQRR